MKVTNEGAAAKPASPTPGPSGLARLLGIAIGGFLLLMLVVVLAQPERLRQAVISLESGWGNEFYAYDRGLAEKWSIAIGNYLRDATEGMPDVPELIVDVPFKGMSKIYAKREEALQIGNLIQGPDDFVKGEIRFEDRVLPVSLRLKGDWNDHLGGRKWSFRVHVRNGEQLMGMRKFSIQSPATRGFQSELMIFDVMRKFGVIAPRYKFVNVTLNGDSMGVMALEEFFAKEMVESNRRREGVIVRFDESLVWRAKDSLAGESVGWYGAFDHYTNAAIDAFGSGKIGESPTLSAQYEVAAGMLRGFVDGRLRASEVFDVELSGRYLAIADMFGAWHIARWPNVRFYFNPITLKLEPIAFDANLQKRWTDQRSIANDEPLVADWLADPAIAEAYRRTLNELKALLETGELAEVLQEVEAGPLRVLQTEFRMLGPMDISYLSSRTAQLLQLLDANGGRPANYITWAGENRPYPLLAHLVRYKQNGQDWLEISNAVPKDVEVYALAWIDEASGERTRMLEEQFPLSLAPRGIGSQPQRKLIALPPPPSTEPGFYEAMVRLERRPWYMPQRVSQVPAPRGASPIPSSSVNEQLELHSFLKADGNRLSVGPGDWLVREHLIIPPGYELKVAPGASLRFAADALLLVNGPIEFAGTAAQPIQFMAATDAGWPGMVVLDAGRPSRVDHTIVRDTTSVVIPGWTLTGGVNFYASDVEISNSRLLDSRGEDALNIIRSEFLLRDTEIRGTASDAFDADFATGRVEGGLFADVGKAGGGDAVDVSGSDVVVDGTRFENISDKALSVGEASRMRAVSVTVQGAGTGAAAKDGSVLTLSDSVINGASFAGLTAYIKKPEYGPARIEATGVQITAAERPVLAQTGSVIAIDGTVVETEDVDVDALYETIMRPGLRK
jgi:hypothetical protein